MKPQDAYNRTLDRYRQLYLVYLLRSEAEWQKRMKRAGDEAQAIILEHADEDGRLTRRGELNRRIRLLSQALAGDLERHLRRNITVAALLGAKGTSDAHAAYLAAVSEP